VDQHDGRAAAGHPVLDVVAVEVDLAGLERRNGLRRHAPHLIDAEPRANRP
jgi:hypothetical protein